MNEGTRMKGRRPFTNGRSEVACGRPVREWWAPWRLNLAGTTIIVNEGPRRGSYGT